MSRSASRINAAVEESGGELNCKECSAVVGVVQLDILKALLGMECPQATCPQCRKLKTFPALPKCLGRKVK